MAGEDTIRPIFPNAIKQFVGDSIFKIRSTTPGIIVSYDPNTRLATVQPTLKETLNIDGAKPQQLAEIDNVYVVTERTKTCYTTFPIKPGDGVVLAFTDRSLDSWLESDIGDIVDPQSPFSHELSSCVAYLGFYPKTFAEPDVNPDDFRMGRKESEELRAEIKIDPLCNISIATDGDGVVKLGTDTASRPTVPADALKLFLEDSMDLTKDLTAAMQTFIDALAADPTMIADHPATVAAAEAFSAVIDIYEVDWQTMIDNICSDVPASYGLCNYKVLLNG